MNEISIGDRCVSRRNCRAKIGGVYDGEVPSGTRFRGLIYYYCIPCALEKVIIEEDELMDVGFEFIGV